MITGVSLCRVMKINGTIRMISYVNNLFMLYLGIIITLGEYWANYLNQLALCQLGSPAAN